MAFKILSEIIKRYLPDTLEELGIESKSINSAKVMTYFRWLHGLQSARPVKKVDFNWRDLGVQPQTFLYHSR